MWKHGVYDTYNDVHCANKNPSKIIYLKFVRGGGDIFSHCLNTQQYTNDDRGEDSAEWNKNN